MISRRLFFQHASLLAALPSASILLAAELSKTPRMTEGPFYPDKLPLDTDNDLLVITDNITSAAGEISHVTGRVLGVDGAPIRNCLVEIWQCDNDGRICTRGLQMRKSVIRIFRDMAAF